MSRNGCIVFLKSDGTEGTRCDWYSTKCVIGSDSSCDIIVNLQSVAPLHCFLQSTNSGAVNVVKSAPDVFELRVNGNQVYDSVPLKDGSLVTAGTKSFRFFYPSDHSISQGTGIGSSFTDEMLPLIPPKSTHKTQMQSPYSWSNAMHTPRGRDVRIGTPKSTLSTRERYCPTPPRPADSSPNIQIIRHSVSKNRRSQSFQRDTISSQAKRVHSSSRQSLGSRGRVSSTDSNPTKKMRISSSQDRESSHDLFCSSVSNSHLKNEEFDNTSYSTALSNQTTPRYGNSSLSQSLSITNDKRRSKSPKQHSHYSASQKNTGSASRSNYLNTQERIGIMGASVSASTPTFSMSYSKKGVSFGPNLSPEQFDKSLPPSTPVKKGATPVLHSVEKAHKLSARPLLRYPITVDSINEKNFSTMTSPEYRASTSRISGVISMPPTPDSNLMDSFVDSPEIPSKRKWRSMGDIRKSEKKSKSRQGVRRQSAGSELRTSQTNRKEPNAPPTTPIPCVKKSKSTREKSESSIKKSTTRRSAVKSVSPAGRRSASSVGQMPSMEAETIEERTPVSRASRTPARSTSRSKQQTPGLTGLTKLMQTPRSGKASATRRSAVKSVSPAGRRSASSVGQMPSMEAETIEERTPVSRASRTPARSTSRSKQQTPGLTGLTKLMQTPRSGKASATRRSAVKSVSPAGRRSASSVGQMPSMEAETIEERTPVSRASRTPARSTSRSKQQTPGLTGLTKLMQTPRSGKASATRRSAVKSVSPAGRRSASSVGQMPSMEAETIEERTPVSRASRTPARSTSRSKQQTPGLTGLTKLMQTPRSGKASATRRSAVKSVSPAGRRSASSVGQMPSMEAETIEERTPVSRASRTPARSTSRSKQQTPGLTGLTKLMQTPRSGKASATRRSAVKSVSPAGRRSASSVGQMPSMEAETIEERTPVSRASRTPARSTSRSKQQTPGLTGLTKLMQTPRSGKASATRRSAVKSVSPAGRRSASSVGQMPSMEAETIEERTPVSRASRTPARSTSRSKQQTPGLTGLTKLMQTPRSGKASATRRSAVKSVSPAGRRSASSVGQMPSMEAETIEERTPVSRASRTPARSTSRSKQQTPGLTGLTKLMQTPRSGKASATRRSAVKSVSPAGRRSASSVGQMPSMEAETIEERTPVSRASRTPARSTSRSKQQTPGLTGLTKLMQTPRSGKASATRRSAVKSVSPAGRRSASSVGQMPSMEAETIEERTPVSRASRTPARSTSRSKQQTPGLTGLTKLMQTPRSGKASATRRSAVKSVSPAGRRSASSVGQMPSMEAETIEERTPVSRASRTPARSTSRSKQQTPGLTGLTKLMQTPRSGKASATRRSAVKSVSPAGRRSASSVGQMPSMEAETIEERTPVSRASRTPARSTSRSKQQTPGLTGLTKLMQTPRSGKASATRRSAVKSVSPAGRRSASSVGQMPSMEAETIEERTPVSRASRTPARSTSRSKQQTPGLTGLTKLMQTPRSGKASATRRSAVKSVSPAGRRSASSVGQMPSMEAETIEERTPVSRASRTPARSTSRSKQQTPGLTGLTKLMQTPRSGKASATRRSAVKSVSPAGRRSASSVGQMPSMEAETIEERTPVSRASRTPARSTSRSKQQTPGLTGLTKLMQTPRSGKASATRRSAVKSVSPAGRRSASSVGQMPSMEAETIEERTPVSRASRTPARSTSRSKQQTPGLTGLTKLMQTPRSGKASATRRSAVKSVSPAGRRSASSVGQMPSMEAETIEERTPVSRASRTPARSTSRSKQQTPGLTGLTKLMQTPRSGKASATRRSAVKSVSLAGRRSASSVGQMPSMEAETIEERTPVSRASRTPARSTSRSKQQTPGLTGLTKLMQTPRSGKASATRRSAVKSVSPAGRRSASSVGQMPSMEAETIEERTPVSRASRTPARSTSRSKQQTPGLTGLTKLMQTPRSGKASATRRSAVKSVSPAGRRSASSVGQMPSMEAETIEERTPVSRASRTPARSTSRSKQQTPGLTGLTKLMQTPRSGKASATRRSAVKSVSPAGRRSASSVGQMPSMEAETIEERTPVSRASRTPARSTSRSKQQTPGLTGLTKLMQTPRSGKASATRRSAVKSVSPAGRRSASSVGQMPSMEAETIEERTPVSRASRTPARSTSRSKQQTPGLTGLTKLMQTPRSGKASATRRSAVKSVSPAGRRSASSVGQMPSMEAETIEERTPVSRASRTPARSTSRSKQQTPGLTGLTKLMQTPRSGKASATRRSAVKSVSPVKTILSSSGRRSRLSMSPRRHDFIYYTNFTPSQNLPDSPHSLQLHTQSSIHSRKRKIANSSTKKVLSPSLKPVTNPGLSNTRKLVRTQRSPKTPRLSGIEYLFYEASRTPSVSGSLVSTSHGSVHRSSNPRKPVTPKQRLPRKKLVCDISPKPVPSSSRKNINSSKKRAASSAIQSSKRSRTDITVGKPVVRTLNDHPTSPSKNQIVKSSKRPLRSRRGANAVIPEPVTKKSRNTPRKRTNTNNVIPQPTLSTAYEARRPKVVSDESNNSENIQPTKPSTSTRTKRTISTTKTTTDTTKTHVRASPAKARATRRRGAAAATVEQPTSPKLKKMQSSKQSRRLVQAPGPSPKLTRTRRAPVVASPPTTKPATIKSNSSKVVVEKQVSPVVGSNKASAGLRTKRIIVAKEEAKPLSPKIVRATRRGRVPVPSPSVEEIKPLSPKVIRASKRGRVPVPSPSVEEIKPPSKVIRASKRSRVPSPNKPSPARVVAKKTRVKAATTVPSPSPAKSRRPVVADAVDDGSKAPASATSGRTRGAKASKRQVVFNSSPVKTPASAKRVKRTAGKKQVAVVSPAAVTKSSGRSKAKTTSQIVPQLRKSSRRR